MFGRKKKVDLEELISELTNNDEDEERPIRRGVKSNAVDHQELNGVKFKVEFEGVDELIKELKSLRESIDTLIEALKEDKPNK